MISSTILFNDGWEFSKQDFGANPDNIEDWCPVRIPHDWLIYDTNNLYESSEGWYRKIINSEEVTGGLVKLRFDGVYMDSAIFINGLNIAEWKYGYSAFEVDLTEFLTDGENIIWVRVSYRSPNSRWYSGAGIYRDVYLKILNKIHILSDGIYITPTRESDEHWKIEIDAELSDPDLDTLWLRHVITGPDGGVVLENIENKSSQTLFIESPLLWSPEQPALYLLTTELYENGNLIQTEENVFGFRTIEFSPDGGFFLNGENLKIHGACQHHDLGCLGSAFNKTAAKRQLEILKEMGVNAIRTAHNMPAQELMKLASEMGMMICSEAFDIWRLSKNTYDYARFFDEWAERDVASWIRRDRNYPSVIMWSIGNEIYDTHADSDGENTTRLLYHYVRKNDPKNHAFVTIGSNYMPWENARKCADIVKLAGYNYAERLYHEHHAQYPDWIIYGSETSSTVQSRGIYHFPLSQSVLSDDDEQCSSLGNSTTSWGAKSIERCIIDDRDAEFSPGQFIWSGFDYIGEPTPYHTKNSYFGQIDTAGFKKDSFYIFQSEWTDYKKSPMIHIFPYWDFSEGQLIDVRVCSNAPKIELFFNDDSLGTFDIDHKHGENLIGNWQIPYKTGALKAIAYDENGSPIAQAFRKSFGDAAELIIKVDRKQLFANGSDLAFLEISTVDSDGNPVENANNRININVEGAGWLVGMDNGDSTDYEQYKATSRRLFSGKLLAVIGTTFEPGEIKITVSSPTLADKTLVLESILRDITKGTSKVFPKIKSSESIQELPIRKIGLYSLGGNKLNREINSLTVMADIFPKNADYQDLDWRVSDSAGIDSTIAKISVRRNIATITALGDGTVYLRCSTKNGSEKTRLISTLAFEISGIGKAYLDPYGFISGGLYNASNAEMTNGNERGVATLRDGVSHVGYRGLDFGNFGSNEITLWIFAMTQEEFPIEIWKGMPDEEDSEYICTVTYTQGSEWNTYKEQSFKLPHRLKGITDLCFVLRRKIHIKGFSFKQLTKAYEQLDASENSFIYGDSFKIDGDAVTEIGNNVSIEFDDMDFGDEGSNNIIICGRTPLEQNTIQIRFENGYVHVVDFIQSDEYCEQGFDIAKIKGKGKITFVFLPGCNFDFKYFRFF